MASLDLLPTIILTSLPIIFILFSLFLKWNPHGLPWNWPILGTIPTVIRHIHRIHDRITEVLQVTSCTFYFTGVWFTDTGFLMTVDPANIHHIMSTNFEKYPKGLDFKYIFDVLGDGIFNSDADSWKVQRRIAQSLIVHEKFLEFMAKAAREKVEKGLVPVLEFFSDNASVVDLKDLFLRLAFDSTCMMVTGFDLNSLSLDFPDIPFSKAMDDVQEVLFLRHLYPKFWWELLKKLDIGDAKRMKKASQIIDETIANLMAVKRERLKRARELNNGEDLQDGGADLITWYMVNEHDELDCTDKFLRDTVLNFMIAGRDAFSVTLSWLFYTLSKTPAIVAKIREELEGITTTIPQNEEPRRKQPRIFTIEELNSLVYLHGALCETLRLYPPIAFEHKSPAKADTLPSGHHVKAHTMILFSLYALGRMRSVWGDDCDEFKPERWISERGTTKREPSYKFFSFNAGPRSCLGKGVAFSQLKIVSAAIIHNYNIQAVVDEDNNNNVNVVAPAPSVILHMNTGFKVRVSKRWS